MPATVWPFIHIDSNGVAQIEGARTKVIEVVLDHLAYAWDAEEIHRQHPHLSLPQVHAALGYYFDHQAELDRLIDAELREVEELREKLQNPVLQAKFRALKRVS